MTTDCVPQANQLNLMLVKGSLDMFGKLSLKPMKTLGRGEKGPERICSGSVGSIPFTCRAS